MKPEIIEIIKLLRMYREDKTRYGEMTLSGFTRFLEDLFLKEKIDG